MSTVCGIKTWRNVGPAYRNRLQSIGRRPGFRWRGRGREIPDLHQLWPSILTLPLDWPHRLLMLTPCCGVDVSGNAARNDLRVSIAGGVLASNPHDEPQP